MPRRPNTFTISGPGVDRNGYESGGVALSAAITIALRGENGATYYVRCPDGDIFGHAETDDHGVVTIHRHEREGK